MLTNTPNSYGSIAKFFHWAIALLIIGLVGVGIFMTNMPPSDTKWFIYGVHKALGILALALVFTRLVWKIITPSPALLKGIPGWQNKAAMGTHHLLYLFMFLSPLSGVVMSIFGGHDINFFGLFSIPAITEGKTLTAGIAHEVHEYVGYLWLPLLAFHIGAALYHHFFIKDNTLKRMLREI